MKQNAARNLIIGVAIVVVAGWVGRTLLNQRLARETSSKVPEQTADSRGTSKRTATTRDTEGSTRITAQERKKFEVKREFLGLANAATSSPAWSVDPEHQPRAYMTADFRGLDAPPEGFKLENVVLTDEGFTLPPPAPGEENKPRTGIIESPPQMFDFFSNAITPMWKEKLPDGTDMFVEAQVSPDGVHWGPWQWVEIDEDAFGQVSPTYPDGRPNPNYGYTIGTTLAWGLTQWGYVRYRVRLFSEGPESPVLSMFRIFFQDSTLGEGRIADPATMPQVEFTETAQQPASPSEGGNTQ